MREVTLSNKIFYLTITLLLSILCFYLGKVYSDNEKTDRYTVDFQTSNSRIVEYREAFISPVGLHYLYMIESRKCPDLKTYFDTLSYFRKNLVYFNISDTNYLIIFKPDKKISIEEPIFGFSKNKFFIFEPKEMNLINFPIDSSKRGASDCIISD